MSPLALLATALLAVTVQGDSLTVDSGSYLRTTLPGHHLVIDAKSGRGSAEGLRRLRGQPLTPVVVFAHGTNDDANYPSSFAHDLRLVRRHLRADGRRHCLVMASIWDHGPKLNSVVRRYADAVAPWAEAVARGKVSLADGVHPATLAGSRLRAKLIAQAIHRCERKLRRSR